MTGTCDRPSALRLYSAISPSVAVFAPARLACSGFGARHECTKRKRSSRRSRGALQKDSSIDQTS
jgi:hypothetical protein